MVDDRTDLMSGGSTGIRPVHRRPSAVALVVAGGFFGVAAREAIDQTRPTPSGGFPLATLIINLSGAFVLGVLLEALVRSGEDVGSRHRIRLVGGTGFCGAFTTYSTFSVEVVQLGRHGDWSVAAIYLAVSVTGGLAAAAAGIAVAATRARATIARLPLDPDVDPGPGSTGPDRAGGDRAGGDRAGRDRAGRDR